MRRQDRRTESLGFAPTDAWKKEKSANHYMFCGRGTEILRADPINAHGALEYNLQTHEMYDRGS